MAKITKHGGATNKALVVEPVVLAAPVEVPEVEDPPERVLTVYDTMLRTQLQDLCRERGLVAYGNKDELVARLVASDAMQDDVYLITVDDGDSD